MSEDKKPQEFNRQKIELANKIANQSQKVANTYQHVEDILLRIIRWFSTFIDKTLFNTKYTKLVSLILAILMYPMDNYDSSTSLYTSRLSYRKD